MEEDDKGIQCFLQGLVAMEEVGGIASPFEECFEFLFKCKVRVKTVVGGGFVNGAQPNLDGVPQSHDGQEASEVKRVWGIRT